MKKAVLMLAVLVSSSLVWADVCQVKPAHNPENTINIWALKKGQVELQAYTLHDIDLDKAIEDRDSMIASQACTPEPVLEKCKLSVDQGFEGRILYNVKIGDKVAEGFGNLPYVDEYSQNKALELIDKLDQARVCKK